MRTGPRPAAAACGGQQAGRSRRRRRPGRIAGRRAASAPASRSRGRASRDGAAPATGPGARRSREGRHRGCGRRELRRRRPAAAGALATSDGWRPDAAGSGPCRRGRHRTGAGWPSAMPEEGDADLGQALALVAELARRRLGEVDQPVVDEGPAVVDPDDDRRGRSRDWSRGRGWAAAGSDGRR